MRMDKFKAKLAARKRISEVIREAAAAEPDALVRAEIERIGQSYAGADKITPPLSPADFALLVNPVVTRRGLTTPSAAKPSASGGQ